jgi:hypothetical protein
LPLLDGSLGPPLGLDLLLALVRNIIYFVDALLHNGIGQFIDSFKVSLMQAHLIFKFISEDAVIHVRDLILGEAFFELRKFHGLLDKGLFRVAKHLFHWDCEDSCLDQSISLRVTKLCLVTISLFYLGFGPNMPLRKLP